ncbi:MAG: UDP-N-acetylmuramoyl-L-alanyl-D-glutamate--2,6-diaminopimelate ligase [Aquificae bacterium]|nr:UDP-N-acetylmuramoyl-L-alanyl-D-glutamate--2,6-diaminopimelate ligase [Aquificota bacterium]
MTDELLKLVRRASAVTDRSEEVKPGSIFFAIRGTRFDGHGFIPRVLGRRPLAVVVERDYVPPKGLDLSKTRLIRVENTRRAFALACREFFGRPDERLKILGVTGTNGKTSTTFILASLLEGLGFKTGVVGTVFYRAGGEVLGRGNTTPGPREWYSLLREMVKRGVRFVAAEVSSHALDQCRICGTRFEGVVFTNLSRDHLDYHRSLEDYFAAKRSLFSDYFYRAGAANFDDPFGRRLVGEFGLAGFGRSEGSDYRILSPSVSLSGSSFVLETPEGRRVKVRTNLVGGFQIFNLAGALALLDRLGFELDELVKVAERLEPIPGRFEKVFDGPFKVVVDYAHTPDALEKLLESARRLTEGRLIVVFGAGGNRDRSKRAPMGRAAERFADLIVLTSDNPRFEEPEAIIADVLEGISDRSKVLVEPDRRRAIRLALEAARPGDLVVVAGKGHEDYQEIKGKRHPFDDRKVVLELLEDLKNGFDNE